MALRFVDFEPGNPRLEAEVLPVLRELRTALSAEAFAAVYAEGFEQGLRFTAAYDGQRCIGVAGWRLVATTVLGRKLYVDDLVTLSTERSRGVGSALIAELVSRARAAGCRALDLDSALHRTDAHRFYIREGLPIVSFHFARALE